MKTAERREAIKSRLLSYGEIQFEALAREFNVSEMTIRRDAEHLENSGLARRVRGGIISVQGRAFEPAFETRRDAAFLAKRAIAEKAARLLSADEVVILDGGSTVLEVAREINRLNLRLTVITPSLLAALEVIAVPDSTVIMTGGSLRHGELSLIGTEAEATFANLNCDTYVAGVAGLDAVYGLSEYHRDEARVKSAAFRSARRVILVADESKLGRVHLVSLRPLSELDVLVTDAPPTHPVVEACLEAGVQVIHSEAESDEEFRAVAAE
jgi:DeoR/GlpR family transcriptional regulator of sugar metabolism